MNQTHDSGKPESSEHTEWVKMRQELLAANTPKIDHPNGYGQPFWTQPTRMADCYDNR